MPFSIPVVVSAVHVRTPLGKWGTDVKFENGVVLKYTNKVDRKLAIDRAKDHYMRMYQAGFTEAEIIQLYGAAERMRA